MAVIGEESPRGICGSGLIDAVAELLRHGVIDPSGRLLTGDELPGNLPDSLKRRVIDFDSAPAFVLVSKDETRIGEPIILTQRDIREVQLAKGAIRAGIEILLRQYGLALDDVREILLAGGFGNFIRRSNAVRMGMLPGIPSGEDPFCRQCRAGRLEDGAGLRHLPPGVGGYLKDLATWNSPTCSTSRSPLRTPCSFRSRTDTGSARTDVSDNGSRGGSVFSLC